MGETSFDASEYVHEHEGRWVVAAYRDGTYYAPVRPETRRASGASAVFGPLSYVAGEWNYKRRADALRRARQLYEPEEN